MCNRLLALFLQQNISLYFPDNLLCSHTLISHVMSGILHGTRRHAKRFLHVFVFFGASFTSPIFLAGSTQKLTGTRPWRGFGRTRCPNVTHRVSRYSETQHPLSRSAAFLAPLAFATRTSLMSSPKPLRARAKAATMPLAHVHPHFFEPSAMHVHRRSSCQRQTPLPVCQYPVLFQKTCRHRAHGSTTRRPHSTGPR